MPNAEEFIIKLQQQVSGPIGVAKNALQQMEQQIAKQVSAVKGLGEAHAAAAAKVVAAQAAQKNAIGRAAFVKATNPGDIEAMAKAYREAAEASVALKSAKTAAGASGEALAKGRQELQLLNQHLPKYQHGAEAAAAKSEAFGARLQGALAGAPGWAGKLAAVILAITTALVTATAAAIGFAVAAADAARSARLLNDAAGGSATKGAELTAVVADLANRLPQAKSEIAAMGRALEIAHLSGRRMQNALEAMGLTAAAVGPQAASKLEEIATRAQKFRRFWIGLFELEGTGLALGDVAAALSKQLGVTAAAAKAMIQSGRVSVDQGLEAMAAAARDKFGKTVAGQMLSLTTQLAKLKENFAGLFAGINIEPVLEGLKMITSLFAQNTVTGRTLKLLVETLFSPLLQQGSVIFPILRAFLQGILIGTLALVIVFLKVKKAIVDAFGGESAAKIDWVKAALYAGIALVGALAFAFTALAVAATVLWIGLLLVMLPVITTMALIGVAVYFVVRAIQAAAAAISSIDLGAAATNMVNSFVNGIKANIGSVVSSMLGLGAAAAGALKSALGIASPSKVALDAAHNVTATFAGAVEDGQGETQAAFSGVVDPKASASGTTVQRSGNVFNIVNNYTGTRDDHDDFMAKFKRLMEQLNGEGPIPAGGT